MVQVEILMYVAFGFATAALIALLLGRLMWNLAIGIGRRRAQRTSPTPTVAELQAERDRLRAEHAMLARRVELRLDDLKRQVAEHMAEVSRSRNRMDQLGTEIETRDAKLADRDAEIARLKEQVAALVSELAARNESLEALQAEHGRRQDEIAALSQKLAERDQRIEELQADVDRLSAARTEAVSRERNVQERLKTRIEDLTALTRQIEEQRRQLEHQQSQSQALRETLAEQRQPEADGSAGPAPLETGRTDGEEQPGPPLERRVEDAERQASELQNELDRLDEMWTAKLADVARAVGSEPAAAETDKDTGSDTDNDTGKDPGKEPAMPREASSHDGDIPADKVEATAVVNGSAGTAADPATVQAAGSQASSEESSSPEDDKKSGGLANVISLAQRIRALQRNGQ